MAATSGNRPSANADRILIARLDGIAPRHARFGGLTADAKTTGAAELREVAEGRVDLLAEVAGVVIGSVEGKGLEYEARGNAKAELGLMAGADEELIPRWVEVGRERAKRAGRPPFSQPGRTPRRP